MNSINQYFTKAELAQAAYGIFPGNVMAATELTDDDVGMSSKQAENFISKWQVAAQYTDPITGVSATVFEEISMEPNIRLFAARNWRIPVISLRVWYSQPGGRPISIRSLSRSSHKLKMSGCKTRQCCKGSLSR